MYQSAVGAMGPRFGARILQTIGFNEMEMNPLNLVGKEV